MIYRIEKIVFNNPITTNQNVDIRYKAMPVGVYTQCGFQELTIPFQGNTGQLTVPIDIECVTQTGSPTQPYWVRQGRPYQFALTNDPNDIEQYIRVINIPIQSSLQFVPSPNMMIPAPNQEENEVKVLGMEENANSSTLQTQNVNNIITNVISDFKERYSMLKDDSSITQHTGIDNSLFVNGDWTLFVSLYHEGISTTKTLFFAGDSLNSFSIKINSSGNFIFEQRLESGSVTSVTSSIAVPFSDWYKLKIKKTGNDFELNINNSLIDNITFEVGFIASSIAKIRIFTGLTPTDFLKANISNFFFYEYATDDFDTYYFNEVYSSYSIISESDSSDLLVDYSLDGEMFLSIEEDTPEGQYNLVGNNGEIISELYVEKTQTDISEASFVAPEDDIDEVYEQAKEHLIVDKDILIGNSFVTVWTPIDSEGYINPTEYKIYSRFNSNKGENVFKFTQPTQGKVRIGLFKENDYYPNQESYNLINDNDVYDSDNWIKKVKQFIGVEFDYDNNVGKVIYESGNVVIEEHEIDIPTNEEITITLDNKNPAINFTINGIAVSETLTKQMYMSYEYGFEVLTNSALDDENIKIKEISIDGLFDPVPYIQGNKNNLKRIQ